MNSQISKSWIALPALAGALALTVAAPRSAEAAPTTANAKIVNVVQVDYTGIGGIGTYSANAASVVTVDLKKAALNLTAPPSDTNGNPGIACTGKTTLPATLASGTTVSKLIALTATANGKDDYILGHNTGLSTDVTNINFNHYTMAYDGSSVSAANPTPVTLGSAIVLGYSGSDTLTFPGGALDGFAQNDIVIVELSGSPTTKMAYLVDTVTVGTPKTHGHSSGGPFDTAVAATAEVLGSLKLKAYPATTITLTDGSTTSVGGGGAPAFGSTAPVIGVPVGEMVLVRLDTSAFGTSNSTPGVIADTLTTTDSSSGSPASAACQAGYYEPIALTIQKQVRNVTMSRSFATSDTGKSDDIMEYKVTVTSSKSTGSSVVVTDNVPKYSTLVTWLPATAYGSAPDGNGNVNNKFAQISQGANVVNVTRDSADSETQPVGLTVKVGYGKAAGTAANDQLTFYLGKDSTSSAGGTLPNCSNNTSTTAAACAAAAGTWITSYDIIYQVKID